MCGGERQPGAHRFAQRARVPGNQCVGGQFALAQPDRQRLLELRPRDRARPADTVADDADPLPWDVELVEEQVELREPGVELRLARTHGEKDGVGGEQRLAMAAPNRADAAGLCEQEADVGDHERVRVCERFQAGSDRARLVELGDRLPGVRGCEQHRRPAAAADKPALEQLAECGLAVLCCADEREQRALRGVGAEPQRETAVAEQVELDQQRPPVGGRRARRASRRARSLPARRGSRRPRARSRSVPARASEASPQRSRTRSPFVAHPPDA